MLAVDRSAEVEAECRYRLRRVDDKAYNSPALDKLVVRQSLVRRGAKAFGIPRGPMSNYEVEHRVFKIGGEAFDSLQSACDYRRENGLDEEIVGVWADRPCNEPARKKSYKASMATRGRGHR